jgi:hypothetical protein
MKFKDLNIYLDERCSLGREEESGQYYLSIPVFNGLIEYEEYYAVSPEEYATYSTNAGQRTAFTQRCRARELDDRLIQKPGRIRGDPC